MISINELGITSDSQLKQIANDLHIDLNWVGYEHHLLDQPLKNGGYILNIGDDTGTHWTALYVLNETSEMSVRVHRTPKPKSVFYFDSFAVPPNNEIFYWCQKNKVQNLDFNNKEQFQAISENLCGIWCIVFLYYMQNGKGSLKERFNKLCEALD
jgi:hypothetical protein